jgi:hypothetical protein
MNVRRFFFSIYLMCLLAGIRSLHAQTADDDKMWMYCRVQFKSDGNWHDVYTGIFQTPYDNESNEARFGDAMAKYLGMDRASVDPVMCFGVPGFDYQQVADTRADDIKDNRRDGDVIRVVSWPPE